MLIYLIVGFALLGLIIGSFLNVVIYRVPQHLSLVSPNSFCPACSKPILRRDNVPVLSWLLLKGRCRSCGAGISARYPLVEILCAGLFAGAAARVGFNGELPALLILLSALLALASIDLDQLILPKVIVYVTLAGLIVALVADAMVTGQWHRLLVATICSASWFVIFFAINAFGPHLLGFGDVRLSLVLGFGLGWLGPWYVALGFFAANLIGAVVGLALIWTKRMSRQQPIPYGVFLALGTAFAVFVGPEIVSALPRY